MICQYTSWRLETVRAGSTASPVIRVSAARPDVDARTRAVPNVGGSLALGTTVLVEIPYVPDDDWAQ